VQAKTTETYDISLFDVEDFGEYRVYAISPDKECNMKGGGWINVMDESISSDEFLSREINYSKFSSERPIPVTNVDIKNPPKYKIMTCPMTAFITLSPPAGVDQFEIFQISQEVHEISEKGGIRKIFL
jgi:hypothetical protein